MQEDDSKIIEVERDSRTGMATRRLPLRHAASTPMDAFEYGYRLVGCLGRKSLEK